MFQITNFSTQARKDVFLYHKMYLSANPTINSKGPKVGTTRNHPSCNRHHPDEKNILVGNPNQSTKLIQIIRGFRYIYLPNLPQESTMNMYLNNPVP